MTTLPTSFLDAVLDGSVEVVDLTSPLDEHTPVIQLPPEYRQPWPLERSVISSYEPEADGAYWFNLRLSEHTGTHMDLPVHWASGRGGASCSDLDPALMVGRLRVVDVTDLVATDPGHLVTTSELLDRLGTSPPADRTWLLLRTGWADRASDPQAFLNAGVTPGVSGEAAEWLAAQSWLTGFGVETVGIDAGTAHGATPPFPAHHYLLGRGKLGLTQLRSLDRLPAEGAMGVAAPLPLVGGSGSPVRVLAFVPRPRTADAGVTAS